MTLTIKQVAAELQTSVKSVQAWIIAGELRAFSVSRKIGSRKPRWRVTAEALTEFMATRATAPAKAKVCRRRQANEPVERFFR